MEDEKPVNNLPEHQDTSEKASEQEPLAEDLSESELEDVSGGTVSGSNSICGFGC